MSSGLGAALGCVLGLRNHRLHLSKNDSLSLFVELPEQLLDLRFPAVAVDERLWFAFQRWSFLQDFFDGCSQSLCDGLEPWSQWDSVVRFISRVDALEDSRRLRELDLGESGLEP